MGFPGEEIVSTAVEKLSDTLIQKMDYAEEKEIGNLPINYGN